jgi:glycosyltransferase involved in cell wall biosynthesis
VTKASNPRRLLFTFWGRRGAMTTFTLQLAKTCLEIPHLKAEFSISRQNEDFEKFGIFGNQIMPIDTFSTNLGALTQAWRIPFVRQQVLSRVRKENISAVIDLMPHVWSPFILPAVRKNGVRVATIIHDADSHPGDRTSLAKPLIDFSITQSDFVITLSQNVEDRLSEMGKVRNKRLVRLFHPDLEASAQIERPPLKPDQPLRLLFLGRIMPYKGLSLFIEAVERLQADGLPVQVGVFGEGDISAEAHRLESDRGGGCQLLVDPGADR